MTGPDDVPADPAAGRSPLTRAQARDEMLARLAAQVRTAQTANERRLAQLEASTAESADLLAQAVPRIDAIAAQLDAERPDTAPAAVCWPTLSAEQASAVWTELADWIETVLVGWYGITRAQLPDCWALHRPVVAELTWLHATYREAHAASARAALAAEWHTRWRPAALAAIAAATDPHPGSRGLAAPGCRPGRHTDPAGQLPDHLFTLPTDEPPSRGYIEGRERVLARREFWQANYLTARNLDHDWRQGRDRLQS